MHEFIAKYQDQISGVLIGFDRLVFRGHLRALSFPGGMNQYLASKDSAEAVRSTRRGRQ